jgi:hypothetical protein
MLIFSTDKQSLSVPPFFSWALITDLFLSRAAYCILPTAYFSWASLSVPPILLLITNYRNLFNANWHKYRYSRQSRCDLDQVLVSQD